MQQQLPHHTPLLGPGAGLTAAQSIYHQQLRALQAAQDALPDELRSGETFATRALVHAVVDAYLQTMRTGAEVTTTVGDGTTVYFQPSGLAIYTGQRDPERGPGLFVQIDTDGVAETDTHPGESPKLAVFLNDSTAADTTTTAEATVWLAEGVNGPVILADERDAHAYCDAHGIEPPTPLLVADRQTAADLIGDLA